MRNTKGKSKITKGSSSRIRVRNTNLTRIVEEKSISALVVDSSEVTGPILKSVLHNTHGVDTDLVTNGQEALVLIHAGSHYDLVIIEMDVPVIDGIQVTRELREMDVTSFILGASDSDSEARIKEFKESGVNTFMKKPINMAEIASIVQQLSKE